MWISAGLAPGCFGDPFVASEALGDAADEGSRDDAETADDAGTEPDAELDAKPDTPGDAEVDAPDDVGADAKDAGPETPCGLPRNADAPLFTREVCFPASSFLMGSTSPNLGTGYMDHTPEHEVRLDSYFLDAYEVTVGRYDACLAAGVCPDLREVAACSYDSSSAAGRALPVFCADYAVATTFCAWDERRLPTEAEWERAARGTAGTNYPWGDLFTCDQAVLGSGAACKRPTDFPEPVASRRSGASPEVLFDLSGNVAEWVFDWAASYPNKLVENPQGPATGTWRVTRGGSWVSTPTQGVAFARSTAPPKATRFLGFRCARSAEKSE